MKKPVFLVLFFILFISAENPISIDTRLHFKDQAGRTIEGGYVNVDNATKDGSDIIDGLAQFTIMNYPTGIEDIKGVENVVIDYYTITGQRLHSTQGTITRDGDKLRVKPNSTRDASNQLLIAHVRGDHFEKAEKVFAGTDIFYLSDKTSNSGSLKSQVMESFMRYIMENNSGTANPFSFINDELLVPGDIMSFEDTIIVNRKPSIVDENYSGGTIKQDTIIPLINLILDDDANYAINIIEGAGNASINGNNLQVIDDVILDLTANDGVHEPVTKRLSFTKEQAESIILKGKTFIIGKYADSQFYDADNEAYVNSRKEPNMTFALTNLLGDTLITVTSDNNAEYEVELKEKEPHYYMISPGKTHEALVQILIDSTMNVKNIGAANNKGENAMSRSDNMDLMMRYSNIDGGELEPPTSGKAKTMNWKKQYYFDEGFDFIFVDQIYDFQNNKFIKEMTQAFKDTIRDSRKTVNKYTNNFFKNGTESWQSDFSRAGEQGVILTYGYTNDNSAGSIGRTIRNDLLVSANIGFNTIPFENGAETFPGTLYEEQLSVETLSELSNTEKPNTLDGGGGPTYINNHAITSVEWGQVRRRAILKDGDEKKGVYGWDMDERGLEAAVNNQYIRDFVYDYGSQEAIDKMEELMAGTKDASLPATRYETVEFFEDREPEITIYTKDNYKQLLEQNDVQGIDRAAIESLFQE